MHRDVFRLYAEIIELTEKPQIPNGEMGQNLMGHTQHFNEGLSGQTSFRAIVDLGLLDVEQGHIELTASNMKIAGASSDMIVVDLQENEQELQVGDYLEFSMDYMGLLRLMNSEYVDKRFENENNSIKFAEKNTLSRQLISAN